MNTQTIHVLGRQQHHELMERFLRWQCRVRQLAMREAQGRPDEAVMPALTLAGASEPLGHIITVLSKHGEYDKTPELKHMVKRTHDPAQRRDKAIEYFSEKYYQYALEFGDTLTATFPPASPGAAAIVHSGECTLSFEAYNQRFDLLCTVTRLGEGEPLYEATLWHNLLFNPDLHPESVVLGFEPDWGRSSAEQPA